MTTMPIAATRVTHEDLRRKIQLQQARIGIIGLGYVGLPLALLLGRGGQDVTGFEIDACKVENLVAGESYIARIEAR